MVAATVFEPSPMRERGRGGWAEVVIPDRGVVEVEDDTPPQADVAERAGTDGGGGGVVLEETLRAAVSEMPPVLEEALRAAAPEVPPAKEEVPWAAVPEATPTTGLVVVTQGALVP